MNAMKMKGGGFFVSCGKKISLLFCPLLALSLFTAANVSVAHASVSAQQPIFTNLSNDRNGAPIAQTIGNGYTHIPTTLTVKVKKSSANSTTLYGSITCWNDASYTNGCSDQSGWNSGFSLQSSNTIATTSTDLITLVFAFSSSPLRGSKYYRIAVGTLSGDNANDAYGSAADVYAAGSAANASPLADIYFILEGDIPAGVVIPPVEGVLIAEQGVASDRATGTSGSEPTKRQTIGNGHTKTPLRLLFRVEKDNENSTSWSANMTCWNEASYTTLCSDQSAWTDGWLLFSENTETHTGSGEKLLSFTFASTSVLRSGKYYKIQLNKSAGDSAWNVKGSVADSFTSGDADATASPLSDLYFRLESATPLPPSPPPPNHPPTLSFSQESAYAQDGIDPGKGVASTTAFSFKVVYSDADNDPPNNVALVLNDGATTTRRAMTVDSAATGALYDGNSANGEQYAFSATFPKGDYLYHIEAIDATTTATTTARLPATGELSFSAGYSSVLFLPGLEGSRLYRTDPTGGAKQLWEPYGDALANDLFLDNAGASIQDDVYTKEVIGNAYVPLKGDVYRSVLADLGAWKNDDRLIADYGVAPYDWRLSLDTILSQGNQLSDGRLYYSGPRAATTTPFIIQELRRLAGSSKTGKVSIVAHSNGGLLAKALTGKLGATEAGRLIDKIIFVAVPQAGTPHALGALLHGFKQALPIDLFPFALSSKTARAFAQNMPSAYPLLPSSNYFTFVDTPVVAFDGTPTLADFRARYGAAIHSAEGLRNFITDSRRSASSSPENLAYPSVGNAGLLSAAETLHSALDTWSAPQGVSLYEIAGWGEDTVATVEYYEGKEAHCSDVSDIRTCSVVPAITYRPREVIEGDGTVLVPSALWTALSTGVGKYWVNLREYGGTNFGTTINRKHADIFEVPQLRTLTKNIITNSTSTLPTFISRTQPVASPDDTSKNKRLRFLLHSPLYLSATDNAGNTVSSSTSSIPGSRYERYGEVQVLSVPRNTPVTLTLAGYASGSLTLDSEEIDGANAVISSSTLLAVPVATSTKATMSFTSGTLQSASSLAVDYDGNGTADFSLTPKAGESVIFSSPKQEPAAASSAPRPLTKGVSGYGGGDNAHRAGENEAPCLTSATTTTVRSLSASSVPCATATLSSSSATAAPAALASDTVVATAAPAPLGLYAAGRALTPESGSAGNRESRRMLKERGAAAKRTLVKKAVVELAQAQTPAPRATAQKSAEARTPAPELTTGNLASSISAFSNENDNQENVLLASIKAFFAYWYRTVVRLVERAIRMVGGATVVWYIREDV